MWNRIEQGDNLDIMRTLPDASIDLIYCDILYGTGRDFGDYKDLPAKRDVIEAFYCPRLPQTRRVKFRCVNSGMVCGGFAAAHFRRYVA